MSGYCWDDQEHKRQAESDARYHRKDYEQYDRYSDDPCKQVYVETYDRELQREREREEVRAAEDAELIRMENRHRFEREQEEQQYCELEPIAEEFVAEEFPDRKED